MSASDQEASFGMRRFGEEFNREAVRPSSEENYSFVAAATSAEYKK